MASTNPWPTSRAESAAWSQVTRARRTIASSRASMRLPHSEQLHYHVLERALVVSDLCAQLLERTEPYDPPAVQHEDPGGNLLRVGHLMDAQEERGACGRPVTKHRQDVEELQGVEGREGLVEHDHGSGGAEGREERHPSLLASRQPPGALARQLSHPEALCHGRGGMR